MVTANGITGFFDRLSQISFLSPELKQHLALYLEEEAVSRKTVLLKAGLYPGAFILLARGLYGRIFTNRAPHILLGLWAKASL